MLAPVPASKLVGEELGGVPVPSNLGAEVEEGICQGCGRAERGAAGNGMTRLSSGEASVCGKQRERPFSGGRG